MVANKLNIRALTLLLCALFIGALWGWLTWMGVSVGDDLGYCFADLKLHGGEGVRVSSLADIFATQSSHFMIFNGRVIVHSLVQFMLMAGHRPLYIIFGALMGLALWWLICKLGRKEPVTAGYGLCIFALMLWLLPEPGVIWWSLVAFGVNYLWSAVPFLWLILLINKRLDNRKGRLWPILLLGVICGALQESFSLPLFGAVGLLFLITRRRDLLWIGIALLIGLAALLCAPGNYAHAEAGGGFSLAAIGHKCLAMLTEMLRTPLIFLAAIYLVSVFYKPLRKYLPKERTDLFLLLIIACALGLGVLTFTALRQLIAPSLCAFIIIIRFGRHIIHACPGLHYTRLYTALMLVTAAYLIGGISLRLNTLRNFNSLKEQISKGENVIWSELGAKTQAWPFSRLNDDPLQEDLLFLTFDTNTRKGLKRLYHPNKSGVLTIIPATRDSLSRAADFFMRHVAPVDSIYPSRPLDATHSLVAVIKTGKMPKIRGAHKQHIPYATVMLRDTLCIIVPRDEPVHLRFIRQ